MMKDVFISYSTKDQEAKKELVALFEKEGISYFLDENDLKIDEKLNDSLEQSLRNTLFTVLLVSENSLLSPWVNTEILFRLMQEEFHKSNVLLPVLLDKKIFEEPGFEFKVHDRLLEQLETQKSLRTMAEDRKMNTAKYNNDIERLEKILPNISNVFHKLSESLSAVFYETIHKAKEVEKLITIILDRRKELAGSLGTPTDGKNTDTSKPSEAGKNLKELKKQLRLESNKSFTEVAKGVSFQMVYVEGGSFEMGSNAGEDDEKPVHTTTLTDYHIAETEVTQKLWRAVMGSDPDELHNKGCDECPVENVSWDDIVNEFLPRLNQLTGKKYSLPTEAQWEYAARGGRYSKGYTYAGSNSLDSVAWYDGNYEQSKHGGMGTTHPVKTKNPNELGLYDMSGNVWEWCQDSYDTEFYGSTAARQTNPVNNTKDTYRVLRGGSWNYFAHICRVASRNFSDPGNGYILHGFRLCFVP